MKPILFAAALALMLTACAEGKQSAERAGSLARKHYVETGQKIREIFTIPPKENPKPKPANSAYCYKAMQDVVCYNVPIEGQQERMTGFQEGGQVGASVRPLDGTSTPLGSVESNYLVPPVQSVSVGSAPPLMTSPVPVSNSPLGSRPPQDSMQVELPGQTPKKPVSLMEY